MDACQPEGRVIRFDGVRRCQSCGMPASNWRHSAYEGY